MYVLNIKENNGFIVMSASTVEKPILAYANEGKFDLETLSDYDGVDDWVFTKYLKITGLNRLENISNENTANQWNAVGVHVSDGLGLVDNNGNPIKWEPAKLISESTETHGPLLGDITWDQSYNTTYVMYNNNVRFKNCAAGTAPAGCVAVAMGQIMKYHNHPNIFNITTMYPYVTTGSPYNYNTQPAYDIANLLENIGTNVKMQYECSKSGAASQNARNAFNAVYNYSTNNLAPFDLNSVITDILNNKPVYLDGVRKGTPYIVSEPRRIGIFRFTIGKTKYDDRYAHAWVTDGYEKVTGYYYNPNNNTYFYSTIANHLHMNWGWGGNLNGWYDYETWADLNGVVDNSLEYIYDQNMISKITPN